MAARDGPALETVVDALVAEQPLIAGRHLGSRRRRVGERAGVTGRRARAASGGIVDAAIATSFALGVTDPDASGVGGDSMAILF